MLRNPRCVSEWFYGVLKFERHPMTRKRVARRNDDGDVLRFEHPELAIIEPK
jgi:hypothetical protein